MNIGVVRRICILSFAFFLPLCFSIRLEDGFELTQAFSGLVLAAFLFLMSWKEDWIGSLRRNTPVYAPFLVFLSLGIISFIRLARETTFYFPTQNYLWVLSALLFLAPLGAKPDKRRFYAFLVFSGIAGSLYSFAQALGLDLAGWNTRFGGRSFSTLGNPVFWAGHLLILLPLAAYLAFSTAGKRQKWLWFGAIGILTLSLADHPNPGGLAGSVGGGGGFGLSSSWKKPDLEGTDDERDRFSFGHPPGTLPEGQGPIHFPVSKPGRKRTLFPLASRGRAMETENVAGARPGRLRQPFPPIPNAIKPKPTLPPLLDRFPRA